MEYKLSKGAIVTYGGTDKMAAIFHTAILNAFYRMKMVFVPKGPINNIIALIQIMDWRRPGDKPLSETMVLSLLTHICVTRPQWVKTCSVCGYCFMGFLVNWWPNKIPLLSKFCVITHFAFCFTYPTEQFQCFQYIFLCFYLCCLHVFCNSTVY